ncbi:MAG: hypothetical protein GY757_02070 [bacterium]|nr:hypothetical protein [bacterium]
MAKYLEIKWQGRAGQGVVTASTLLAEVLALEGKYVQAIPEFIAQMQSPSILSFNRISESPIKSQAAVKAADVAILMDTRLILHTDVKANVAEDAVYIFNTTDTPEFLKERLSLENNKIFTLDADKIIREETSGILPNIPLLTVALNAINVIPMDSYRERLKELLTPRLTPELTAANIETIDKVLSEGAVL